MLFTNSSLFSVKIANKLSEFRNYLIHETIAVSVEMGAPEYLAQMVHDVNMTAVTLDERLSNNVYHYDKDLRKLELATDVPEKG